MAVDLDEDSDTPFSKLLAHQVESLLNFMTSVTDTSSNLSLIEGHLFDFESHLNCLKFNELDNRLQIVQINFVCLIRVVGGCQSRRKARQVQYAAKLLEQLDRRRKSVQRNRLG